MGFINCSIWKMDAFPLSLVCYVFQEIRRRQQVKVISPGKTEKPSLAEATEGEGGAYRNRTDDLLTASQVLYPSELMPQNKKPNVI